MNLLPEWDELEDDLREYVAGVCAGVFVGAVGGFAVGVFAAALWW